jgi:hypothetical protein
MAYSLEEQYSLDINWYFTDRYNRLCVATSAGGKLPTIIAENEKKNSQFHKVVIDLPEKFEIQRNLSLKNEVQGVYQENFDSYFRDFEILARKGFYVFDRFNLSESEDTRYNLVVYPLYNPSLDSYPIDKTQLELIPRAKGAINKRQVELSDLNKFIVDLN